ncbi:MAG: hypothetical protein MUC50_23950, partial [Myxococcota bacterium]|nr:hypothetical protein [Myxococcota bacterium]
MTLRPILVIVLFSSAFLMWGCGSSKTGAKHSLISVTPPPDLPRTSRELLALANEVLETGTKLDELTVGVAALEALAAKPAGGSRPEAFEVDFRMAKACFLLAELEPGQERRSAWLEKGQISAQRAVRARPDRVEGTYYLAVIIGRQAEELGLSALPRVRRVEELGLKAMALDPKFENAGPYRLLAMVYAKAPPWPASIGDTDRALELAQQGVKVVDYPLNHYILAE